MFSLCPHPRAAGVSKRIYRIFRPFAGEYQQTACYAGFIWKPAEFLAEPPENRLTFADMHKNPGRKREKVYKCRGAEKIDETGTNPHNIL